MAPPGPGHREWRSEPGEIPFDPDLFDPTAPGPSLDPGLFQLEILAWRDGVARPDLNQWTGEKLIDPTTGEPYPDVVDDPTITYETEDLVIVEPDDPRLSTSSLYATRDQVEPDPNAPGPTLDPGLDYTMDLKGFGPDGPRQATSWGDVIDDQVESSDPNAPGPALDPALLDPNSSGPPIDPALLDPDSPGPTIDPSLLDPNAPGPTLDPALLDLMSPGPTLETAQLEQQGIAEPGGGFAEEPAGVADQGFTDPGLTESPPPEPHTPGHDLDDHQAGIM